MVSRRLCLCSALLFSAVCSVALAQHDSLWVRTMYGTGSGIDEVQALASDPSGNIYALIRGQAGLDTDMVIVKYSATGERLWWRRLSYPGGVEPCGIAVDGMGNVFVTGTSANETDHPGIVTMEYSPNGDSCWTAFFTAEGLADSPSGIQVDIFGDVLVSGTSTTAAGGMDATLIKYSNSGALQWSRVFDCNNRSQDTILASVLDSTGSVYLVGSSDGKYLAIRYTFTGVRSWARTGGSSGGDYLISCALDINHDLLTCGWSEFSYDSTGILTVKYDAGGSEQWSRCIAGNAGQINHAVGVAGDSQADVVVYGWWGDAATFSQNGLLVKYAPNGAELWRVLDPDTAYWHSLYPGAMTISPSGEIYTVSIDWIPTGILTVKYSPNGDSLWVRYDSADVVSGDWSQAIVCVPGGVCVGGALNYRDDEKDVVTHYRADGTGEWTQSLDSSYTGRGDGIANDVAFDQEGDVIAVGYLNQTDEYYEFATAKYSPTGDLLWLRTEHGFSGMYDDEAFKVKTDSSDNIYVTGWSEGETTSFDYLTVKYDASGNRLWARFYDGPAHGEDRPTALAVDGQGNVIVTGRSDGGPTGPDYATVKYSPVGDELWVRRYSGDADSSLDEPEALAVDSAGSAYVTGWATETQGYFSGVTVKYDPDGTQRWVSSCGLWNGAHAIGLETNGGVRLCGLGPQGFMAAELYPSGETAWVRAAFLGAYFAAAAIGSNGWSYVSGTRSTDSSVVVAFDSAGHVAWQRATPAQVLGGMGALALDPKGIVYVASGVLNHAITALNAYDTLGLLRWSDSCAGGVTATEANAEGRVVVTGGRMSAWLTALLAPRLAISEGAGRKPEPVLSVAAQPNVFSHSTLVRVRVGPQRSCNVVVYDGSGRQVRRLADGQRGSFDIAWDGCNDAGRSVSEGVYFVRAVEHESGSGKLSSGASAVVKVTKLRG